MGSLQSKLDRASPIALPVMKRSPLDLPDELLIKILEAYDKIEKKTLFRLYVTRTCSRLRNLSTPIMIRSLTDQADNTRIGLYTRMIVMNPNLAQNVHSVKWDIGINPYKTGLWGLEVGITERHYIPGQQLKDMLTEPPLMYFNGQEAENITRLVYGQPISKEMQVFAYFNIVSAQRWMDLASFLLPLFTNLRKLELPPGPSCRGMERFIRLTTQADDANQPIHLPNLEDMHLSYLEQSFGSPANTPTLL